MARRSRAEAPSRPVTVKLSPVERGRLYQAAVRNQQTLSAFLRDAGDAAAAECLEADECEATGARFRPP
jgi:hypothetical protein